MDGQPEKHASGITFGGGGIKIRLPKEIGREKKKRKETERNKKCDISEFIMGTKSTKKKIKRKWESLTFIECQHYKFYLSTLNNQDL